MTDAERAQIEAWLAEARGARHQLLIGASTVSVSSGGKTVSYSQADLARLDLYIASLMSQLGLMRTRPIRVVF